MSYKKKHKQNHKKSTGPDKPQGQPVKKVITRPTNYVSPKQEMKGTYNVYITVKDEIILTIPQYAKSPEEIVKKYREKETVTEVERQLTERFGKVERYSVEIEKS